MTIISLEAYEDARKIELDDEETIETAKEEEEKIGLEKGLEMGKKKEEKIELAKNMRSMGYKTDEIAEITGLPSNEIDNL